MKKNVIVVVAACVGFASAAFAGPTKLSCPEGSAQRMVAGENLLCTNKSGKIVAGPEVMLYPNGAKMAQGQVDEKGMRTGTWTLFDEKGVKTHTIDFAKGDFHGKWTEFYANGVAKKVINYNAGAKVGAEQLFDMSGKVVSTTADAK